jgi:putative ABC transport system permease protein
MSRSLRGWLEAFVESVILAHDSIASQPGRSLLAVAGVVVGIVTVVLVSAVLAGARNQVALLFRELGTENLFAYHLSGDPYAAPTTDEAQRRELDPGFARPLADLGQHVREVAVQLIVPVVQGARVLTARANGLESENVLVEGVSPNWADVVGADLRAGRPFTEIEDLSAARVAIVGANVARALFGEGRAVGGELRLGGASFTVVGELWARKGGFLGENRQDNVVSLPLGTARRLFPDARATVLYIRAEPGQLELARIEVEGLLRRLRGVAPDQPGDFALSSSDQIISNFDQLSAAIGLATVALAGVSLFIGGIGIANVMIIAVRERTREIGVRIAIGARRREVARQFLLEAAILSGTGGLAGVLLAGLLGLLLSFALPGFSAVPPPWIVAAGLLSSVAVGVVAGYWPARRAAALDPVEALRYE